ncbi:MAG: hypothetical protein HRT62_15190 [Epibacterium sp.]|nr:hypothetical protein [Epibacterium sp.]
MDLQLLQTITLGIIAGGVINASLKLDKIQEDVAEIKGLLWKSRIEQNRRESDCPHL